MRDDRLDRWWTPPELARLWRCDPKTARARLRTLNQQVGCMLFPDDAKHVRVLGRVLESAVPGCLSTPLVQRRTLTMTRELNATVADLTEWRDDMDEWRESVTRLLARPA